MANHDIIELVKVSGESRLRVPAVVVRDLNAREISVIEERWRRSRRRLERIAAVMGQQLQHAHWDWTLKAEHASADTRFISIRCDRDTQGMMSIRKAIPRLPDATFGELVYVDYLETAPWNLQIAPVSERYAGVGTVLIADAIRISRGYGFGGQIGLHALPFAERYYREFMAMTDFGPDLQYQNLNYFEYNAESAAQWLERRGS